jgi:hypothetical protein
MIDPHQPPAQLRRFAHLHPADGMCLMEYVSLVAGAPFSDRPTCTSPLLGALARAVNDAMSDAGRTELTALAPALAKVGGTAGPREADRIAYLCWDAVCAASAPGSTAERRARRRRDAALRHQETGRPWGVPGWIRLHGPGRRAVEAATRTLSELPAGQADRALYRLLADCIKAGHTAKARPRVSA